MGFIFGIVAFVITYHPEFEEILADCCCNEDTVQYGVGKEKQEEFVVGKADTVVHPRRKRNVVSQQK